MKALEKDRGRRYATANEFSLDLERQMSGDPIAARPPQPIYVMRKYIAKHAAVLSTVCSVMLLLVAGLIGVSSQYRRAQDTLLELRHTAYRQALTSALIGDESQTRQSKNIAERAGATTVELAVLEALLQYTQGRFTEARDACKAALETDSGNFIAQAILAKTAVQAGQDDHFPAELMRLYSLLDSVEQLSDEQRLLLAATEIFHDPTQALRTLDSVSVEQRSPLKLAIRSEANFHVALIQECPELLDEAIAGFLHLDMIIGDNLNTGTYRLLALTCAIELARRDGLSGKEQRLLAEAEQLQQRLASFRPEIASLLIFAAWVDRVHFRR